MRKIVGIFLIIFGIIALAVGVSGARKLQEMKKRTGTALYSNYKGIATITRIKKTEKSKAQAKVAGKSEGYEVWFVFELEKEEEAEESEKIKESWGRRFIAGEHLFKLANGLYPNAKYIEKYKVKPGKTYECTFRVMKQGTGTPFIFVIDGLPKG